MGDVRVRPTTDERHIDEAARIWAEATAARDGDTEIAPLRLARPLIEAVLDSAPARGGQTPATVRVGFRDLPPPNGHSDEFRQGVGHTAARAPMTDLRRAHDVARAIASAVLGRRDPGPMTTADSISHHVYVGADVVVKIIDAVGHSRLNREIALAPHLPAGITAPLLGSGRCELETREVRYACYARVPGATPGMGMPGVDEPTARLLAEEAVQRLRGLHGWTPAAHARRTLGEPLDHGGFVSRAALFAEVEELAALNRDGLVPRRVLDGLTAIAERAPSQARADVPVHADCHWGNWLARDRRVTALLDFEWARFGEPMDDWFFLIRFSGPHLEAVLDVVAGATTTSSTTLRRECEVREASYLASDLRIALQRPDTPVQTVVENVRDLEELVVERPWWRHAP
ncbi:phosphotransferase [Micromonospora sp. C31]|uniref:phosphotransferase family protein n=1 Tax=Micromonospora sp. C31 TaxID=2824876 RepID=UPI001B383BC0|nr:phosphotransferase [Micromonospora sp. C31]MBQ1075144.1 phosphotransferase [Micromonospora sp. C31]